MTITTILASREWSELYWLLVLVLPALSKLGKWIRDRSAKNESLPPQKGEKPAPARKASSAPPARAFRPSQAPVAKPFPLMERLEAGLAQLTQPPVGTPDTAMKSAARPTAPGTPPSGRPDGRRAVGGTSVPTPARAAPPASPGPKRSSRKRRPTEPRRAQAEAVAQIARVMPSRDPEPAPPPSHEPDERQGYGLKKLSIHELRRAIVLREILDPPLALRQPDAGRW